jgi:hypothetical protein
MHLAEMSLAAGWEGPLPVLESLTGAVLKNDIEDGYRLANRTLGCPLPPEMESKWSERVLARRGVGCAAHRETLQQGAALPSLPLACSAPAPAPGVLLPGLQLAAGIPSPAQPPPLECLPFPKGLEWLPFARRRACACPTQLPACSTCPPPPPPPCTACNWIPEWLHPHSFHAVFGHNTNLWAVREGSPSRAQANPGRPAALFPLEYNLKGWATVNAFGMARRICKDVEPKDQVGHSLCARSAASPNPSADFLRRLFRLWPPLRALAPRVSQHWVMGGKAA